MKLTAIILVAIGYSWLAIVVSISLIRWFIASIIYYDYYSKGWYYCLHEVVNPYWANLFKEYNLDTIYCYMDSYMLGVATVVTLVARGYLDVLATETK